MKIQYIRDWLNGSNANTGNHWVEIKALDRSGINMTTGATITTNGTQNSSYPIARIIDNNLVTATYADLGAGYVWIMVKLVTPQVLDKIRVWHYYADARIYHSTKTEVSTDGVTWVTLFDSAVSGEYAESGNGKIIQVPVDPCDETSCIFNLDLKKYNPGAIGTLKDSLNNTIYGPQQVCNSDYSISLSNTILRASIDLSASTSLEIIGAIMITDPTINGTLFTYRPSGTTNGNCVKLIYRAGYLIAQRRHDSLVSEVKCPYKIDPTVLLVFDYYLDQNGQDVLNVSDIASISVLNRDRVLDLNNLAGNLPSSLIMGGMSDDAGAGSELSNIKIYQLSMFSTSLPDTSRLILVSALKDKWGQLYGNYSLDLFSSDYGIVDKEFLSSGSIILTLTTTREY